jgi:hypothetical protein
LRWTPRRAVLEHLRRARRRQGHGRERAREQRRRRQPDRRVRRAVRATTARTNHERHHRHSAARRHRPSPHGTGAPRHAERARPQHQPSSRDRPVRRPPRNGRPTDPALGPCGSAGGPLSSGMSTPARCEPIASPRSSPSAFANSCASSAEDRRIPGGWSAVDRERTVRAPGHRTLLGHRSVAGSGRVGGFRVGAQPTTSGWRSRARPTRLLAGRIPDRAAARSVAMLSKWVTGWTRTRSGGSQLIAAVSRAPLMLSQRCIAASSWWSPR